MSCFGIQNAKKVWDYAKTVIDSELAKAGTGEARIINFPDLVQRISDDIKTASNGKTLVPPEDIARLIAMPKSVKVARNSLLLSDRVKRTTLRDARNFVEGTETTPLSKFLNFAYQAPYAAKVIGHGVALHMTHAWPYVLDPANWKNFGKTWVNGIKAMSDSQAQSIRESIQMQKDYDLQLKSGAAVDPEKIYDDVNKRASYWGDGALGQFLDKSGVGKVISKIGEMTSNSFLALKQLRQLLWQDMYDRAPEHLKTDELRNLISSNINHMTGASPEVPMSGAVGKVARGVMFAPSLDIARVMRIVDIGRDIGITMRAAINKAPLIGEKLQKAWGSSSPEVQYVARQNMKQWARVAATFSGLLYANSLLLKHVFNSKEDVNVKDPYKSDWLTPKGPNGRVWQMTGGQLPLIRTAVKMVGKPNEAGGTLGQYLMGKLNPALSLGKTLLTGKTFEGEAPSPLGKGQGTVGNWVTFGASELGPIGTEDGIKEFAKQMSEQNGAPQEHNADFLRAFYKAGLVTIPSLLGTHTYQPNVKKTNVPTPY